MKYAVVENGKVINIALADNPMKRNWIPSDSAEKGDLWDGSVFSKPPVNISGLYDDKETEIIRAFDDAVDSSLGNYTQREIDSWYKQENQAAKWTRDNTSSVPYLEAIATARGSTIAHLVAQIMAKATAYEVVHGGILGKKQKLLDQLYTIDINSPTAKDEINAINW